MVEKKTVCQIVDEWLDGKEYFLVEVAISPTRLWWKLTTKKGFGLKIVWS